jgi:hypothetical protein
MSEAETSDAQPTDPLVQRLAELKAERVGLEEARAKREQERRVSEEIEEQEQIIRDERAIADAEEKYGPIGKKIAAIKTPGLGIVIVKRPHHVTFRKWSDTNLGKDGGVSNDALEELIRPCIVHPSRTEFDRYCEEQPAILLRASNVITKLAGMRGQELSGKS